VADFCECGNESSGSVKGGYFLTAALLLLLERPLLCRVRQNP
jgi:hypothetical protein